MRRAVFVLLALLITLVAGPGCDAPDTATITVWHAYRGAEEAALAKVADAFALKAGVHVRLLAIPFDAYASKLESAVPQGHGPDVFIDAHERLGSYLRLGVVAPAGDAFPDGDRGAYSPKDEEAVTQRGIRYGVPLAEKTLALYVKPSAFPEAPTSFAAIAARRNGLPKDDFPFAYEAESSYFHAAFLHAFGGKMLGDADEFAMTGTEAEASLDLVRGWLERRIVPEAASGALVKQLYQSNHTLAVVSGPWLAAELDHTPFRVVPLPPLDDDGKRVPRPFLTVEAAMLTPKGAEKANARAFARFLANEESAVTRATVGRQVVASLPAWQRPEVLGDATLTAFHEAGREAIPMPARIAMRGTWVPAENALRNVLRGAAPSTALGEAKSRFDDARKPPPPPPSPAPLLIVLGVVMLALTVRAQRQLAKAGGFGAVRRSLPAYGYVALATIAVIVLVILPLIAGAATSFFAGPRGAMQYVGFANYLSIVTARGKGLLSHGSFWLTLLVTILWTALNVFFHAFFGIVLGLLLARPWLRVKSAYRVLLVLPWAVPSYVTALAWKGMFHRQFGAINALLGLVHVSPVSWFSQFSTAFAANVATNVWLGFPFMMVITLGAITSLPQEVLEAASVDGATRWERFRYVTWPLLWPQLVPAITLGAVWTFNMFNVVFLVSGGEPDGQTDILVSEAYRWAFTRDAQYGYAAAYSVLIFLLLFITTRIARKRPRA